MNKFGFLVSYLGGSQLAYNLITSANKMLTEDYRTDIVAFISNPVRAWIQPSFAVMNINEAFDFDGVVFATDLNTAGKALRFPGASRRYFYVWDLEWIRGTKMFTFEEFQAIYTDPRIGLIARNRDHADVIEQCWNRAPAAIVPNCDVAGLVDFARLHG